MDVTLEVVSGPSSGKVIGLDPGRFARVGRAVRSDFSFPHDAHMSAVHFVIEFDGRVCRVRDSDSRNGTFVNGQRVSAATVKNGDQVMAGRTAFVVRIEKDESIEAVAPAQIHKTGIPQAALGRLIAMFRGGLQPLFAVLDAARDPEISTILAESKEQHESLFEAANGNVAHFAPYLARLPEESVLLETLIRQGWGNSWGVYLKSNKSLKEVRSHIRRFLMVRLPEGREVYFRYYDPRVLRLFLPTCTPDEINMFFGPVTCFLMEAEEPNVLLQFINHGRGAEKVAVPLSPDLYRAVTP
jgi:pSer/pThr/pTyr-binding forkhead associated (FHA) protein